MPQIVTCRCGHRWENDPDQLAAGPPAVRLCPACGTAAGLAANGAAPLAQTLTLPPSAPGALADSPTAAPAAASEAATMPPASSNGAEGTTPAWEHVSPPGYEVLSELGRSGMGVVYKARQARLGRTVALKMILSGNHAGPGDLARFRTEAEAIARLQHPHIVQVHEVGEHDGRPFFTLEFCAGGSLERKLAGTPLPPGEAAALVEKLARGMHAAHAAHILHRDLKPANVLLTEDGTPRITDFGLAKKLDEQGQTATGAVMGTPSYMAPEQAGGRSKEVGPAADVYALGAILYECLTGRPPFRAATTLDTILQVVSEDPVPPTRLNARVPRDLETICLKCLEKEPARRYATAEALAEDLTHWQKGEPITARPTGVAERLLKWARRKPALAGMSVLLLLATAAGLGGILQQWRRAEAQTRIAGHERDEAKHQQQIADEERRQATTQRGLAEARERMARRLLYASQMNLALRSWQDVKVGEVLDYLKAQVPEDGREDLRGPEWQLLWRLAHADLKTTPLGAGSEVEKELLGLTMLSGAPTLSPDGSRLALADGVKGEVRVLDTNTGRPVAAWKAARGFSEGPPFDTISALAFLAGDRIAVAAGKEITVWDARGGKRLATLRGHADSVTLLSSDRGGKYLAAGPADGGVIKLWDTGSGKVLREFPARDRQSLDGPRAFAVAPSGDRLAVVLGGTRLGVWQRGGTRPVFTAASTNRTVPIFITGLRFSTDGRVLAVAASDGTVTLRDAGSGKARHRCRVQAADSAGLYEPHHAIRLAFSPDGRRLAAGTRDGTIQVWDVASGRLERIYKGHQGWVMGVAFRPDGQLISVSIDGTVKVWPADGGQEAVVLRGHGMQVTALAFSPDGRRLVSGTLAGFKDDNLKLWDVATGRFLRDFKGHHGRIDALSFSPDGKRVASASLDGTVRIWDPADGKLLRTLAGFREGVSALAFSADGRRLATLRNSTVQFWDPATGRSLPTPAGLRAGTFSRDGERLAAVDPLNRSVWIGEDAPILVADVWFLLAQSPGRQAPGAGLAPYLAGVGQWVKTAQRFAGVSPERGITVRTLADGRVVRRLSYRAAGMEVPQALAFSPDGQALAEARSDRSLTVWDLRSGQQRSSWKCRQFVTSICFSPDGRRVATTADGRIKLWDPVSGQEVYTLTDPSGEALGLDAAAQKYGTHSALRKVLFSPSGDRLVGASVNNVLLWNVAPVRRIKP